MAYPVDILGSCSHEELESLSEEYLSDLRCSDPDNPEYFSFRDNTEIPISLSTVGFVPLYGGDQIHKILALFAPEDTLTAVALFLADQWWAVDDIVRTSNPSREGLQQVRSLGERVVLYVLNRIIYRKQEMERHEVPFLCHSRMEYAKILWRKGEAIGFYSVKPAGSSCAAYLTQSYLLPVLDTMYVRKRYHGKQFGLQVLEDFVDSFTEDTLGLRYPLSSCMYTACKQYLEKYPGDQELLWEVEGAGHWFQRTLISSILQKETRRLSVTETNKNEERSVVVTSAPPGGNAEHNAQSIESHSHDSETGLTGDIQVELEAGHTVNDTGDSKEHELTPVSTRTRSSQLKRPKIGKRVVESEPENEDIEVKNDTRDTSKKLESKEQIVENFKELIQQLAEDKDDNEMAKLQEEISAKPVEQIFEETQDIQKIQDSLENKQDTEIEPVNGDITKELFPSASDIVEAQELASETQDTESNLEPADTDEKSLTTLVSVSMDLEKSFEDSFTDQVLNTEEMETSEHGTMTAGMVNTDVREDDFRESLEVKGTEETVPVQSGDFSDNCLTTFEPTQTADTTPDDMSALYTGPQGEPVINVTEEALPVLRQGPLLVVELEDVAFQQSDVQKSHSGESTVETDQSDVSAQKSVEIGGESSSEEAETETPVIERRGLRRKARGIKGPAKRRTKLSV
ncbi:soluble lamin-associated protein of 75 kDa [Pelobates fuscus]|uniref:soluble lamin-associated protein of 75 kDa n=1 Tax=Pelobates fuscus TaxID=191477 RepID=UPI002FE4889D